MSQSDGEERATYRGWLLVELQDVTLDERNWFFEQVLQHEINVGELVADVTRVQPDPTPDEERARIRERDEQRRYRGD